MPESGEGNAKDQFEETDIYRPDLSHEEKIDRQTERMKTKLYVARKVDGVPNKKELEIIREIETELSEHPAFIGVTVFGSAVDGYGDKNSDIDIRILYDDSKFKDLEDNIKFLEIVKRIFPNGAKGPNVRSGREIDFYRQIISVDKTIDEIRNCSVNEDKESALIRKMAEMTRAVTGEKINDYREIFKKEIEKLPLENRQGLARSIIDYLSVFDLESIDKRSDRMPELTGWQHQEILRKRKEMWERRIQKVWGIN